MRIGLDLRYLNDHFPGIGRYALNLAQALVAYPHTFVCLYNPDLPNSRYAIQSLAANQNVEMVPTNAAPFSLREQIDLPRLVSRLHLSLLHSPYYIKPYRKLPCPSVVTIHDLIGHFHPQTLAPRARYTFRILVWLAIQSATRLIAVSESGAHDLQAVYQIPKARITVTPEAAAPHFRPQPPAAVAALRARLKLPQRYLLTVGSNKPHKNREHLILAWSQIEAKYQGVHLIIAGHYDPQYPQAQKLVEELDLSARVRFIHNVAEGDLPSLYTGAEAFIFPSLYEGFGLPVLEAMACGTPVICAQTSSLPEVAGEAAFLVDPHDLPGLVAGMQDLLNHSSVRQHRRKLGLERAQTFTWQRTAELTMYAYKLAQNGG
jgi:glycosyltransferase involved in cell wall biosynthesis